MRLQFDQQLAFSVIIAVHTHIPDPRGAASLRPTLQREQRIESEGGVCLNWAISNSVLKIDTATFLENVKDMYLA